MGFENMEYFNNEISAVVYTVIAVLIMVTAILVYTPLHTYHYIIGSFNPKKSTAKENLPNIDLDSISIPIINGKARLSTCTIRKQSDPVAPLEEEIQMGQMN